MTMTRTSFASRLAAPAGLALAALMLVASPVGLGKTGLGLQSARADTSVDKQSNDPANHDATSQDPSSKDSSSNGPSGTDHSNSGNAGTNGGSHDSNGGSGGSKDGGSDH